jgi:hypothetical protein
MRAVIHLVMLRATPVTVVRDVWDWLLYAVSAVAAITAVVVFSRWALEQRRRPEAGFLWWFSPEGDPAHSTSWPPNYVPEVKAGQPFLVDAAIQNTGDMAGSDTLINFVAPDCFELRQRRKPEEEPLVAGNDTAGLPPDNRVVFFAPRPDTWTPVNWFLCQYRLRYLAAAQLEQPLRVRLLFDVSDNRFNSRGRRWLPSIAPPLEPRGAPVGTPGRCYGCFTGPAGYRRGRPRTSSSAWTVAKLSVWWIAAIPIWMVS